MFLVKLKKKIYCVQVHVGRSAWSKTEPRKCPKKQPVESSDKI